MALVQELGMDENTIFIFASDNGPLYNRLGATDTDFFQSAGNLRGRKGSLYEGGIRVPAIVRWKGHIKPGTVSERVTGFEDWLPTILELLGVKGIAPKDVDGISFAPSLLGQKHKSHGHSFIANFPPTEASKACAWATGKASGRT